METSLIDALSIPLSACPWSVTSVTLCFVPYPPALTIEGPEGSRWHSFAARIAGLARIWRTPQFPAPADSSLRAHAAPVRVGGPRIEAASSLRVAQWSPLAHSRVRSERTAGAI